MRPSDVITVVMSSALCFGSMAPSAEDVKGLRVPDVLNANNIESYIACGMGEIAITSPCR